MHKSTELLDRMKIDDDFSIYHQMLENRIKIWGDYTYGQALKDYIIEVLLLVDCDCLFGGKSGSSVMTNAINGGKYRHMEFLEDKHCSKYY